MITDTNSIVFLIVTKPNYHQRLIYECVKELELYYNSKQYNQADKQNQTKSNQIKPNQTKSNYNELSLNKNFLQIFKKLYEKYNNRESIDKLFQVTNKINQVKDIMHENINIVLENTAKLETIELKSEESQQSA